MRSFCTAYLTFLMVIFTALCQAEDVLGYLIDGNGNYTGPTLEQNVVSMDTDKNGFADVDEVRAFLQLKHGKDYQKNVLDKWLVAAKGQSCGTSFSKDLTN